MTNGDLLAPWIDDLLDEGLAELSADELVGLTGRVSLRRRAQQNPGEEWLQGDTFRSPGQDLGSLGDREGRRLLQRALPELRRQLAGQGAGPLGDWAGDSSPSITREGLALLSRQVGDLVVGLVESAELAVLVLASILKRGVHRLTAHEGLSALEADFAFESFELRLGDREITARTDEGEVAAPVGEHAVQRVLELEKQTTGLDGLRQMGGSLWELLFTPTVRAPLERALGRAKALGLGVRIELRIEDSGWLGLPFELLRYPGTGEFVAASAGWQLVRTIVAESFPSTGLLRPLRLQVAVAEPATLPKVESEREIAQLEHVAREHGIDLETISGATASGVRRALDQNPVQAFHFIGHGAFLEGEGYLLLEHPEKRFEKYDGERLAHLLRRRQVPEVVVLNTCQGADSTDYRGFVGLAPRLVQSGVPTVVAMRGTVENPTALLFAETFYRHLAQGFSPLFAAQKGRGALFNDLEKGSRAFAQPLIFGAV